MNRQRNGYVLLSVILVIFSNWASAATITGTSAGENLIGTNDDDSIYGLEGDDFLYGGLGNDLLDGGPGSDTAVFQGYSYQYQAGLDSQGRPTVTRTEGTPAEGTETLVSIEWVSFYDKRMPVPPPPSITLEIVPSTVLYGQQATMTWATENAYACYFNNGIGSVATSGSLSGYPPYTLTYTLTAYGLGGISQASATVTVNHAPTVSLEASPTTIYAGESATLTWTSTYADTCSIDQGVGSVSVNGSVSVSPAATTTYTITATGAGGTATYTATVTVEANPVEPQPEGSFGQQYEDLIPADATHEVYEPERFALITGLVHDVSGDGIEDVAVSILDHADFGTAQTDADGRFTLPVEGGETLTVKYAKTGFIPAQRQVAVPWNDTAVAETLVLIARDTVSTAVTFDENPATVVVHESSTVSDASGSRACTLVFTGDNEAHATTADGQDLGTLSSITVRVTEFATPESMPAVLPPTSGYTYCVDMRADEAEHVRFDDPVITYVDNFLGFPVGTAVPVGYYDESQGIWVPEQDGVVVRLLDTDADGIVDALDATGDGVADDLNGNSSYADEVTGLGDSTRYAPGATFWRVATSHFSAHDFNWPYYTPEGVIYPNPSGPVQAISADNCGHCVNSYVTDRSRVYHEDIPIPGTGMTLHYASDRVEGYHYTITVPASGAEVPDALDSITVKLQVAGRTFEQHLDDSPSQTAEFEWDGLDALGRPVTTNVIAKASVGFEYRYLYSIKTPSYPDKSFGLPGDTASSVSARTPIALWNHSEMVIPATKGRQDIAEGWTLSPHHQVARNAFTAIFRGDGTMSPDPASRTATVRTVAGQYDVSSGGDGGLATQAGMLNATSMVYDEAGNLYIAEASGIRKVDMWGYISTVTTYTGKLDVDAGGNLYVASGNIIRKVTPQGGVTVIAGNGNVGHAGDGGPATDASFTCITGVAVDAWGNLYIADSDNPQNNQDDSRVRRIDVNGTIVTIAGGGPEYLSIYGDPIRGTSAILGLLGDIAVANSGRVYVVESGLIIECSPAGDVSHFAGHGEGAVAQDGWLAMGTAFVAEGIDIDESGNIYVADDYYQMIFRIEQNGIVKVIGGLPWWWMFDDYNFGEGIPPREATIEDLRDVAVSPSGDVCYLEDYEGPSLARRITRDWYTPGPDTVIGDNLLIPDEDGSGLVVTPRGLHLQTIDLRTRMVLAEFGYDSEDRLTSVTDRFGNAVTIQRDGSGVPTAIVSPDGLTTTLTITNNRLMLVGYADGGRYDFEYSSGGLMTLEIDPNNNEYEHTYDAAGRVVSVSDPLGGEWASDTTTDTESKTVSEITTAEGNATTYTDFTDSGGQRFTTITGPSGDVTSFSALNGGWSSETTYPSGMTASSTYSAIAKDPALSYLPERLHPYLQSTTQMTPAWLMRTTSVSKAQSDSDADGYPDVFTESVTVNDKTSSVQDSLLTGVVTATSPLGRTATVVYDPDTLLVTGEQAPGVYDTVYGYDTRGRLVSAAQNTRQVSCAYNAQGFVGSVTDPLGRVTDYAYDAVGRVTAVNRPDNTTVSFGYDANGNMTALVTATNATHSFYYDAVDQMTDYVTPLDPGALKPYTYVYDRDRRLVQTVFPSGLYIQNVYSGDNLAQVQTPEGNVNFTYYCPGKVQTVTKGSEQFVYAYDGALLTRETRTGTLPQVFTFTYNNDFALTSFGYAGGTASFAYDNDGLVTQAGAFTIARNAATGFAESVSDGTAVFTPSYNGYGEVSAQSAVVGGLGVMSWGIDRNNGGLITAKTETVGGTTANYAYTYDTMGRLLEVVKDGIMVETYTYGANGQRLTETNTLRGITNRAYTYSLEDHLLSTDTATYAYDDDGFLTAKVAGMDTMVYDYSSRGELLQVTLPDDRVVTYVHDPMGRRIAKRIDGITVEKYLWAGMTDLLAVYDGSNNLVMRFDGARMTRNGSTYYLVTDQVGTVRAVVDASGTIVKRIDYDSFGNILTDTNPTFTIPFGFAGGLHDRDTGLVRFGARDYDPDSGRWTAKDPIGFAGGDTNLYGYCVGNPVCLRDPNGQIIPLLIAAGVVVWTGVEIGLSAYDTYDTVQTVLDPSVSATEKGISVGLFAVGVIAPGGGYESLGKKAVKRAGQKLLVCEVKEAGEVALDLSVKEGVYVFRTADGLYVGQSGDIPRRIAEHIRSGRLSPEDIGTLELTEVSGGKLAREIAEQKLIDKYGLRNLANERNAISEERARRLGLELE